MFRNSIRWRFALWMAFLLVCLLSALGVTAYQLHRSNRFSRLDEELKSRLAALSSALRTPPENGPDFKHFHGGMFGPGDKPGDAFQLRRPPPDLDLPSSTNLNLPPEPPRFRGDGFGPGGKPGKPDGGFMFQEPPPDLGFPDSGGPGRRGHPRRDPWRRQVASSAEIEMLFADTTTNGFYYAVWLDQFDEPTDRSTNAPASIREPAQPGNDTRVFFQTFGSTREAFQFTERSDCILVGRDIRTELAATRRFAAWLATGGFAVLVLGVGGAWWLAGRALRPVTAISAAASRISAGNLTDRINIAVTEDELGELATTLNSTFARLEAAFTQQKQFTADASHELRTPLAVLISEAQVALARERTAAEYRETVQACLDTAQEMRHITDALMQLARFDAGQEKINLSTVDIAELATECVELLQPLADQRGLRVISNLASAPCRADYTLMKRVITNLVSNAIYYSAQGGEIRVTTSLANNIASLTVFNTGPGIAPEDLPHIFKRFYRADRSRNRSEGRYGLGLAITKAIVDAHGAQIDVSSKLGQSATFTIRISGLKP